MQTKFKQFVKVYEYKIGMKLECSSLLFQQIEKKYSLSIIYIFITTEAQAWERISWTKIQIDI